VGPGVQDLEYGLEKPTFFAFDIYDSHSKSYLNWYTLESFLRLYDILQVPQVTYGRFELDSVLRLAEGPSLLANHCREGIVVKTIFESAHPQIGRMILKAEDKGKGMEVATAIGVDPAIIIGSQAKVPWGVDEFYVAGGLRGAPVKLVPCETIDVEVPAAAEIVIEGVAIPGERVPDGPYGEYPGCYSEAKQSPVVKVTAITMRQNPIYQTALTGFPVTENHTLIEYANAAVIYREARKIVPEVKAVHVTPGGTFRHHVVVSVKKRHDEEARNVIVGLLALGLGLKQVTVVDEDIDVRDPVDVEWALSTRMQPDQDIIIVPRLACSTLDPSVPKPRTTAGWGIDATMPVGDRERFEKVKVPGVEKVKYV